MGIFCPSDVPAGVTAAPQCALQDSSTQKKYCALICSPSSNDAQCGTNASCKSIQGTGLCTYDDDVDTNKATTVKYNAPANGHYEDPKDGCGSDEVDITVQGIQGAVCAPKCTSGSCPSDVPAGVTAAPQCALQDSSSGDKYCALICSPSSNDAQCGTNASCKSISGTGLCTYDDAADTSKATSVKYDPSIVV
jgi:hypothetical protein